MKIKVPISYNKKSIFVCKKLKSCLMRTKGGAGVRTTFWSVQGEGPVSFLKGLG